MGRASKGQATAMAAPVVILVRPQLGENIGMAARAMLNCGLSSLRLVEPARRLAQSQGPARRVGRRCGAGRRPGSSQRSAEAVADLERVVATTARNRELTQRILTPRRAASEMRGWIDGGGEGRHPLRSGADRPHQ